MKIHGIECSEAVVSYLETILWAEHCNMPVAEEELVDGRMNVGEDHPLYGISEQDSLDDHFDVDDFSLDAVEGAIKDVAEFFKRLGDLLEKAREYKDDVDIAYHFWLTRQGHGAGFWDGDYGDIGDELTEIAELSGVTNYLVGEDGKIHQM